MTTFTHGDAQDLLADFKRAWERRDVDLAVSLFAEDAEYRFDPFEEPLAGANAIRSYWNESVAAQQAIDFDAERIWLSGSTVLASWHAAITRTANGERVRYRGFMTLELDGERRVTRFREWAIARSVGSDATWQADEHAEVADGG